jgi:hypothetical protein
MLAGKIGVARPLPRNFIIADFRLRKGRKRQTAHLQPILIGRKRAAHFMRRGKRGHHEQLIEAQTIDCRAREIYMFLMHGVERPAENPNPHKIASTYKVFYGFVTEKAEPLTLYYIFLNFSSI